MMTPQNTSSESKESQLLIYSYNSFLGDFLKSAKTVSPDIRKCVKAEYAPGIDKRDSAYIRAAAEGAVAASVLGACLSGDFSANPCVVPRVPLQSVLSCDDKELRHTLLCQVYMLSILARAYALHAASRRPFPSNSDDSPDRKQDITKPETNTEALLELGLGIQAAQPGDEHARHLLARGSNLTDPELRDLFLGLSRLCGHTTASLVPVPQESVSVSADSRPQPNPFLEDSGFPDPSSDEPPEFLKSAINMLQNSKLGNIIQEIASDLQQNSENLDTSNPTSLIMNTMQKITEKVANNGDFKDLIEQVKNKNASSPNNANQQSEIQQMLNNPQSMACMNSVLSMLSGGRT